MFLPLYFSFICNLACLNLSLEKIGDRVTFSKLRIDILLNLKNRCHTCAKMCRRKSKV